jgi:hypothetical protein
MQTSAIHLWTEVSVPKLESLFWWSHQRVWICPNLWRSLYLQESEWDLCSISLLIILLEVWFVSVKYAFNQLKICFRSMLPPNRFIGSARKNRPDFGVVPRCKPSRRHSTKQPPAQSPSRPRHEFSKKKKGDGPALRGLYAPYLTLSQFRLDPSYSLLPPT